MSIHIVEGETYAETEDRGLRFTIFWSMEIAGINPSIRSISGRLILPKN